MMHQELFKSTEEAFAEPMVITIDKTELEIAFRGGPKQIPVSANGNSGDPYNRRKTVHEGPQRTLSHSDSSPNLFAGVLKNRSAKSPNR